MDICPSHASQAILAAFIREGHFTRHIRNMRRVYAERRRVLVEEIERQLGSSCKIMGTEAGMHVTLLLGDETHDRKIAKEAIRQKLWLSALSLSYVGRSHRQGLVLGFGNAPVKQIPGAVALLKRILTAGE
jgi:GntR family transcriptional regulator/MocR family aminotransferase